MRPRLRLAPRLRWTFYGVFAVLLVTGIGWWIADHASTNAEEFSPTAKAWGTWLLKLHGAAAMFALIVLGALYPLHVSRGWRARRNRFWGGTLVGAVAMLVLTGYLLYYTSDERLRALASAAHLWLGAVLPIILLIHVWRGRASH